MPSAQYVIDIAASMPEGESTIAELDKLTANLIGSGKGAEHFQQAIKQVSTALDAAKKASAAANEALAAGSDAYKTLERAALQTAKAAEKAALSGKLDPALSREAHLAATALSDYTAKLKGLESTAAEAAKKQDGLTKSLANVQKLSAHVDTSLTKQAEATGKLKGALAALGGPLGSLGSALASPADAFAKLSTTMGASNAAAIVAAAGAAAVAAAVAAATVIIIAGTIAIAGWAVGLADTNREYGLTLEATEVLNPSLEKLHGTIDKLGTQTGLTEEAIDGIAISLKEAHIAASDMPAALEAASLAEAALGTGKGASEFIQRLQTSGKSVQAFSATVSAQLGGVVAKKLLGLNEQAGQFKQNIGTLFGSLNIDPALTGLQKLAALFDENTAAGSAIKLLFSKVFQPLIDQADNAATVVEAFALGFLIGLTKTYIALKPVIKAVSEFFGFKDASLTNTLAIVTKAAEYLAPAFVVVLALFGGLAAAALVFSGVLAGVGVVVAAFFVAPLALAVAFQAAVVGAWVAVSDYLSSINLSDVGTAIIQGLANGILGAGPAVLAALGGVVTGAIASARHLLDSHSPSRVFMSIGGDVGEGFALGIDGGADEAHEAVQSLVAPPDASALSAQDSAKPGSAAPIAASHAPANDNSRSTDLSGATFNFYGVQNAESSLDMLREQMTLIFEGDAGMAGCFAPG